MQTDILSKENRSKGADGYYYMSNSSGIAYANRLVKVGNYRYYLLPTAVVQHGEIAGYSLQEQVLPSTADITTSEALQDV